MVSDLLSRESIMTPELRVRDVMSPSPPTIGVQLSLADAGALMGKHQIRHLPVLEGGTLVWC